MYTLLKTLGMPFLHLLYPPLCLHCEASIEDHEKLFCTHCLKDLSLIEPIGRCPYCFEEWNRANFAPCPICRRQTPVLDGVTAACDEMGPPATLLKRYRFGDCPYLAQGAGALMAAQFLQMEWPFPDLLVPTPLSFIHQLESGYNPSQLLAESVGKILDRPVHDLMKIKRQKLVYRGSKAVTDKTLLLIGDTMSNNLRKCAELLWEGHPKAIYGLVLCMKL